jgi:flavin-dependent dehydrogenase
VLIIGAGPAGLINARTLLDDGFHVTIIFKVGSSFRL